MIDWQYTLSEPNLDQAEQDAALACIKSGWLSMGPNTKAFEERFAEMHNVKHAIAVSNGTAALHLAFLALDIGTTPGQEVVQPSLTFVAAPNMTRAVGATPVFADVVALTEPTVDPADVERKITRNTKAVVAMHFGGYPARMKELKALCKEHGLYLIEDACHAPAQPVVGEDGRFLGAIGDVGCFSFFSNKNLTCGEGGMVVTDDDELASRIRTLRSHGMTSLTWERHKKRLGTYDVLESGFNYRIDDLRSAIGLVQLSKLEKAQNRRRELAQKYSSSVAGSDDIQYVFAHEIPNGTAHIATVLVDSEIRDQVRDQLAKSGIQTSLHYPPAHLFSAFEKESSDKLPITEEFAKRVITLPMYPDLPLDAPHEIIERCSNIIAELRNNSD